MLKHIFLVIVLILCYFLWEQRPVRYGPGITVESQPTIERIAFPNSIETSNYIISPRYKIEGDVRVIANKRYWFDEMRHISSVDLLLAWNKMSDEELLGRMLVKINDRSYHVQMTKPPFQRNNIHQNLIMAHTIPSSERVQNKLNSIRRGQLISFSGYIVDIESRIGSEWISPVRDHWPMQRSSQWIWIEDIVIVDEINK